jgi:hypothetical protein
VPSINQGDHGARDLEDGGDDVNNAVEAGLRRRVEDVTALERGQALRLARGNRPTISVSITDLVAPYYTSVAVDHRPTTPAQIERSASMAPATLRCVSRRQPRLSTSPPGVGRTRAAFQLGLATQRGQAADMDRHDGHVLYVLSSR